jgi:CRP/FNR family cyclic AMP-dependent transcriptional regulator
MLSCESIRRILEEAGAIHCRKAPKESLFAQGSASDNIYFINRGKVQITVVSKQGREGIIALLTEGDFAGEISLTPQPLYLDSGTAITDCDILKVSSKLMLQILETSRLLAEYFTRFLLERTMDVQAELVDHLFNSSEKRLARVLLLLANFGQTGKLEPIAHITQEMLADRVGTTRARISFFMNKFRRLGLIDYNGSINVHSGLLNVVLYDDRIKARPKKDKAANRVV